MAKIDDATKRELAVRASVDPRTIDKVVRGEPVRGMAGHRAERALREYLNEQARSGAGNDGRAA